MKKKIYGLLIALMMFPSFSFASNPKKATVINPDTGHRKEVVVGSKTAFDGGYVLEVAFGYKELPDDLVGFSAITDYSKFLSQNITAAATTLPVTSMETTDGHTITMEDLGSRVFLTVEPQSTLKKELVMCTGISGLSFTGCTRGLAFYGTSTAAVAINAKTHNSGSTVTISNVHYVYEELVDKDSDQELTGDITFSGDVDFANIPTSTTTLPTENNELASKLYVDTVGAGGVTSLNASTTQGIVIYPTSPNTIGINASSTGGLEFDSSGALQIKASSTGGIIVDENGVAFSPSSDSNIIFGGDVTFSGDTSFNGTTTGSYDYFYGKGKDGDVVISADATSTRDMFYRNLTINPGVTLNPNGYRIYVSGMLSGGGKIARNGLSGANGGNGATYNSPGAGGIGGSALSTGTIYGGLSGKNGGSGGNHTNSSPAGAGVAGASSNPSITNSNGSAGGSGANAQYIPGAGGAAGTSTVETSQASIKYNTSNLSLNDTASNTAIGVIIIKGASSGETLSSSASSGGGGGGSGRNTSGSCSGGGGGGSGSNGGIVFVAASSISNITFEAKGGNGGNGGNGSYDAGYSSYGGVGGGGAGGSGGLVVLAYNSISGETINVSGGTGGSIGALGVQTSATNGANGVDGKYIKIEMP